MLRQVRNIYQLMANDQLTFFSYDLELDKKLAEETTVLVESYTVCTHSSHSKPVSSAHSFPMAE
jgi:hypothetical protein